MKKNVTCKHKKIEAIYTHYISKKQQKVDIFLTIDLTGRNQTLLIEVDMKLNNTMSKIIYTHNSVCLPSWKKNYCYVSQFTPEIS